ncbi:ArsC family reductase [Vibrio sp. ZSDE26]|uniref:ArsC family reductase n=1 Tax=Vibrio amylolyticus TaxID=2847292 RepID=A0A9X2BJ60_9VIBR|nr:ArsC family reductase [Vibrio amylolyticus]MCK6265444.1 ArsC family reductase [Vibrio amylolyticus]
MTVTMYGIPNCDTIKKAKKWLEANNIEFVFHDYRKQGVNNELIAQFFQNLDWTQVVNKRGTTYRQLTQEQKDSLNEESAIALLLENPAMIKRPILSVNKELYLGFKAEQYQSIFN